MTGKFKILYFGTWGYGKAGLEQLINTDTVELVKIFTKWDPGSTNVYFNQMYDLAKGTGIETINTLPEKLSKIEFEETIKNSGPIDFIISCCFDRFFPETVLKYPKISALNIHPSLLPKYRGVKPLENALMNNESEIGVTMHLLSEITDGGDIVIQKRGSINSGQTFGDLYQMQCFQLKECIVEFFKNPEKYLNAKEKQNELEKSYAPRLPFEIADSDTVNDIVKKAEKAGVKKNE